jgi:hypothetical protein
MVFLVVLVRKVLRVFKDFKGHKGSLVLKEARELKEARVLKEHKAQQDLQRVAILTQYQVCTILVEKLVRMVLPHVLLSLFILFAVT